MYTKIMVLGAVVLLPLAAAAGPVDLHLVKDINTQPAPLGSLPAKFQRIGDQVYFNATTPLLGSELYATDGSSVQLVQDLAAGTASSNPKARGMAGGRLIVEADEAGSTQLIALDRGTGARSTLLSANGYFGPDSNFARPVATLGNYLLFSTQEYLYTTDGTAAGTVPLIAGTDYFGQIAKTPCPLPGGGAVFVMGTETGYPQIWRTDGSPASNRLVTTLPRRGGASAVSAGPTHCYLLFSHDGPSWSLWRSDGNSVSLLGQQGGASPLGVAATANFALVADSVGNNISNNQYRLWSSASAQPLATYSHGGLNAAVRLRAVGNRVLFNAPYLDGSYPTLAVYVSDGTAAGTARLTPAAGLAYLHDDQYSAVSGSNLLLGDSYNLWKIDPAARTVQRLGGGFSAAVEFNGRLIGSAANAAVGEEVFFSNGSTAEPQLLHDLRQATGDSLSSYASDVAAIGNTLYFAQVQNWQAPADGARSLWRSDGSEAGTQALSRDMYGLGSVGNIARAGDGIVFDADGLSSSPVYYTNAQFSGVYKISERNDWELMPFGDAAGAGVLLQCETGSPMPSSSLCVYRGGEPLVALLLPNLFNSTTFRTVGSIGNVGLFFADSYDASATSGLWRSDGTTPGTFRISPDLRTEMLDSSSVATEFGGRLLFNACDRTNFQCGLFSSDGTAAVPQRIAVLTSGRIRDFARVGSKLAFRVGGTRPEQLWISDGTPAGTALLRAFPNRGISTLASVGARLHFTVDPPANGLPRSYYVSDGSEGGTYEVTLPALLQPMLWIDSLSLVALDDDTAAFPCVHSDMGGELCLVDGNGGNMRLAADIHPGPNGSAPSFVGRTADATYFSLDDGEHGRELWRVSVRGDAIFADGFDG